MKNSNRKIIALLIICSTVVGVTIFIDSQKQRSAIIAPTPEGENIEEEYQVIGVSPELGTSIMSDTDSDGLPDWEEVIWATSATNADTDGDGTADGEEKNLGRNPLKKGPNDALTDAEKKTIGDNTIASGFVKNSVTDNFSKNFFESYISAKQGGDLDITSKEALIQDLVAESASQMQLSSRFSKSDLTLTTNSASTKAYGTAFAEIQVRKMADILTFSTKNDLLGVANEYKKLSEELYRLQVPSEVADTHLQIINNLHTLSEAYTILKEYDKDPMQSIFAIKESKRISSEQTILYTRIKNYFTKNGIIFDNSAATNFWAAF